MRFNDPPAGMFDCPLGLKANTPLENAVPRLVAERSASIDCDVELSKLVIVTVPFEARYTGAWIETKDPGEGFDEKYGVQLNVKLTLGWFGSLVDRTRVSMNGADRIDPVGGVHAIEMFDDPAPWFKPEIGRDPDEIKNHEPDARDAD